MWQREKSFGNLPFSALALLTTPYLRAIIILGKGKEREMKMRRTRQHITIHYSPTAKIYVVVKATGPALPKEGEHLSEAEIQSLIGQAVQVTLR